MVQLAAVGCAQGKATAAWEGAGEGKGVGRGTCCMRGAWPWSSPPGRCAHRAAPQLQGQGAKREVLHGGACWRTLYVQAGTASTAKAVRLATVHEDRARAVE